MPIYFEGNSDLSSGGSVIGKPGHVRAHIYPPIDTSDWKVETIEHHIKEVRNRYLQWAGVKDDPVKTEIKHES